MIAEERGRIEDSNRDSRRGNRKEYILFHHEQNYSEEFKERLEFMKPLN
jgi:hypothetical protein